MTTASQASPAHQELTPIASSDGRTTPESATGGKRKREDRGAASRDQSLDTHAIPLANPSNYPRKRVSIACEICRVRKTRCDAAKPSCSFCSQLGVECNYRKPTLGNRPEQGPKEDPLSKIDRRLDRIESLLEGDDQREGSYVTSPQAIAASPPPSSPAGLARRPPPVLRGLYRPLPDAAAQLCKELSGPQNTSPTLDDLSLIGLSFQGLSRLKNKPPPECLYVPAMDRSERYLEIESRQGEELFRSGDPSDLDLSAATRWTLQQSFAKNVLPWFPLFDEQYCLDQITLSANRNFESDYLESGLALFVFALGALSKADHHTVDDPRTFPGINYFVAASNIVNHSPQAHCSVLPLQCRLLMALYYCLCLRPLQAFDAVRTASSLAISLLHMRNRHKQDRRFQEACIRGYWTCYIIEHELKPHICYTTQTLHALHEVVPLPISDHDEAGIYWFLAEISLRRIFTDVQDGVGFLAHTSYQPKMTAILTAQLEEWYTTLPSRIKFPLGHGEIMDLQKAFLRGQYYAIHFVMNWSSIVHLLTEDPPEKQQRDELLLSASKASEAGVHYLLSSESLMFVRHVMLFGDLVGVYCITLLMACAYTTPVLTSIRHPDHAAAVRKGHSYLSQWADNPGIKVQKQCLETVMMQGGLLQGAAPITPGLPPGAKPDRQVPTHNRPVGTTPTLSRPSSILSGHSSMSDAHMMAVDAVLEHGRPDRRVGHGPRPPPSPYTDTNSGSSVPVTPTSAMSATAAMHAGSAGPPSGVPNGLMWGLRGPGNYSQRGSGPPDRGHRRGRGGC